MTEWCGEHPFLTTWIVLAILGTIRVAFRSFGPFSRDHDDD